MRQLSAITLVAAVLAFSACKSTDRVVAEFKTATLPQAKASFSKMYNTDLNESGVTVMSRADLSSWIRGGPWNDRTLPCEIQAILPSPGTVDPSPIALDVSGSAQPKGTRLVYVPIRSKVDCPQQKTDFFLDDLRDCEDKKFVCQGQVTGKCTCTCSFQVRLRRRGLWYLPIVDALITIERTE